MKSIQDLACEVGLCMANDEWPLMQRFHTLAIEQEHKRLMEGSGEAVIAREDCAVSSDEYYTADQMAAAVLRSEQLGIAKGIERGWAQCRLDMQQ